MFTTSRKHLVKDQGSYNKQVKESLVQYDQIFCEGLILESSLLVGESRK